MKKTKKGFTLVELLVVIAILAILATVSVVGYTSFLQSAKDSNAATELHQVVTYVEAQLFTKDSFDVIASDTKYTVTIKRNENTKDAETLEVKKYITDANGAWVVATDNNNNTINDALKAINDFSALKGTFTINNLDITFEAEEGGKATEKFSFR